MPVLKYGFRTLKRARIEEPNEEEKVLKADIIEAEVELIGELINNKMENVRKVEHSTPTVKSSNQEIEASSNKLDRIVNIDKKENPNEGINGPKNISDIEIGAEEKELLLAPFKSKLYIIEEKIINVLKLKDIEISKLSFEKESMELSHQKTSEKMKNLMMTTKQMMINLRQEKDDLTLKVLEKEKELDYASKTSEGMESSLKLQLQKQTSQDELIKTLSSEKNSLQEEKATVLADLSKLKEEYDTLNDKLRIQDLEKQQLFLKQSNFSLEADIKIQSLTQELEKEAENAKSFKLSADTKYDELNKNYKNLQESYKNLENKFSEEQKGAQEQMEKDLKDKISDIEKKNNCLEYENEELKAKNKNIQLEYEQLEQKVGSLKDEMLLFEKKSKNELLEDKTCKKCIENQNDRKVFEKKLKYEKYQMKKKYKERMHTMDKLIEEKEEKIKTLTEELAKRELGNKDPKSNFKTDVLSQKETTSKASEMSNDKTKEVARDPRLRPSKDHNTEKFKDPSLKGLLKKVDKWKNMNIRNHHQSYLSHQQQPHQYYRNEPYSQSNYQNNFNPHYYYNNYPAPNNYYHGYDY